MRLVNQLGKFVWRIEIVRPFILFFLIVLMFGGLVVFAYLREKGGERERETGKEKERECGAVQSV